MSGNTKTVRVTNQGELDEALKAEPSNDMVIVIDSNPGRYFPIYIIVADSRGHWIEARGESRVIAAGKARLTARIAAWSKHRKKQSCTRLTMRRSTGTTSPVESAGTMHTARCGIGRR